MSLGIKSAKASHPLAGIVLAQLGGGQDAIQSARDAANHGAVAGFPGFTYYTDTQAFVRRNRKRIAECVEQMADDLGEGGAIQLVQSFNCLCDDKPSERAVSAALYGGRGDDPDELTQVENALAWFALEEVGHAIVSAEYVNR